MAPTTTSAATTTPGSVTSPAGGDTNGPFATAGPVPAPASSYFLGAQCAPSSAWFSGGELHLKNVATSAVWNVNFADDKGQHVGTARGGTVTSAASSSFTVPVPGGATAANILIVAGSGHIQCWALSSS